MFLLQTYNAHEDVKGAEDCSTAQTYSIIDHPPALFNGTLINLIIYLEKDALMDFSGSKYLSLGM